MRAAIPTTDLGGRAEERKMNQAQARSRARAALRQALGPGRGGRRGYTLVELMIAIVIVGVGLFPVVQLQFVSLRNSSYAEERTGATMLAQAVADELRTRALRWGGINTFAMVFPEIMVNNLPNCQAPLDTATHLRSMQRFRGQNIAPGPALGAAQPLNRLGNLITNFPTYSGIGAIYRIHYTAYNDCPRPNDPAVDSDIVKIIIYVSWDNGSFGHQDYDWTAGWTAGDGFWKRHMVSTSVTLRRQR